MTLQILDVEQGTDEWHAARRGILTASTVGRLITAKTIRPAQNVDTRALTLQLVAERITGNTDPTYLSAEMERGNLDEPVARDLYSKHYATVVECGFMIRTAHNYDLGYDTSLGYSPDGLVGDDGLIEIKSRDQKTQLATILNDKVPDANMAQLQAGLLVSGRQWIDYVSYCSGMHLYVKRVTPDDRWQKALVAAAIDFEKVAADITNRYNRATADLKPTARDTLSYELRL